MGCGMRIRYSGLGIHESTGKNQHQKSEHHDDRKQPDGFAHELAASGRTLYMARNAVRDLLFAIRFPPLAFLNSILLSSRSSGPGAGPESRDMRFPVCSKLLGCDAVRPDVRP